MSLVAAAVLSLSAMSANAAFVQLDISSIVNSDMAGYTSGGQYPPPGATSIGGIPFTLTDNPVSPTNTTWVVGGLANLGGPQHFAVSGLDIDGVTAMYAIINSAFGSCGAAVGSIGAMSGAASQSFTLTEGTNVRDHIASGFCGVAPDAIATADYGLGTRFDVYRFDLTALTAGGALALNELDFDTFGQGINGVPLLAGVTFETVGVPEPATITLLGLGVLGLGALRRRRPK
jgi:hypothetical protein